MRTVSYYTEWPIALGFWILPSFIMVSSVFVIKWVRNYLGKSTENRLGLYLLHAHEDSTGLVSEFIAQMSQEIRGEVLTREDAVPGRSVTQEAIRMVTESEVLVILISKHQDSLMDLVISR